MKVLATCGRAAGRRRRCGLVLGLALVAWLDVGASSSPILDGTQTIITVAGSGPFGAFGGDGGPALEARLKLPWGLTLDATGAIYVADSGNNRIRKIAGSMIATVAGSSAGDAGDGGPATAALLDGPRAVKLDAAGNLYIADSGNHRIRRISAVTGIIETVAGTGSEEFSGDGGPAISAGLKAPSGLAFDAFENLYIADLGNNRVRRMDAGSGIITTVAGSGAYELSGDGGPALQAGMNPIDVAVDDAGNVFIADSWNNRIRRVAAATGTIETFAGKGPSGTWTIGPPSGPVCLDSGDGVPAVDKCLRQPYGVTLDRTGNVYIADMQHGQVRRVDTSGIITLVAGRGPAEFSGDLGAATEAGIGNPYGVALDTAGNLFISGTDRIREVLVASPPVVIVQPGPRVVAAGQPATFTASAIGGPMPQAQWQVSADGGAHWSDIAGARDATWAFIVTFADDGLLFRATFTNSSGSVTTGASRLRVGEKVAGDLDGDGAADLVIYRPPSNGPTMWYWLPSGAAFSHASGRAVAWNPPNTGTPFIGDVDGDGVGDPVMWDSLNGNFYWLTSSNGYDSCEFHENNCAAPTNIRHWGAAGDVPLIGDLDGDGRVDFVVWRPSTGTWYWLSSSNGYAVAAGRSRQWGNEALGDRPLLADMDGDRRLDLVVWRATTGTWFWLTSATDYDYASGGARQWGNGALGDFPLAADFDGDTIADLGVWRPADGVWYLLLSRRAYDYGAAQGLQWGAASLGDVPLVTDVDGDRRADPVVWRATTGTWYWLTSSTGYLSPGAQQWGQVALGDRPLVR